MNERRAAAKVLLIHRYICSPQSRDLLPSELLWSELDRKAKALQPENFPKESLTKNDPNLFVYIIDFECSLSLQIKFLLKPQYLYIVSLKTCTSKFSDSSVCTLVTSLIFNKLQEKVQLKPH